MNRSTTTTSGTRSRQTVIKPSDVHELKLKTQQITHKTRQLRTQLNRLQDRIASQTNAINKTFEQQSETPQVSQNHSNSIPQLKRSVDGAQNTLSSLRDEIEKARQDDKTFIVKELEEEVKLAYCENQRLSKQLQDSKLEANKAETLLNEATFKASVQNITNLKADIRELQSLNATLRDKAVAYSQKKEKLLIEQRIKEDCDNKKPIKQTVDEATNKQKEANEKISQEAEELSEQKQKQLDTVAELRQIIEDQKQKITDFLAKGPDDQEEKEGEPKENENEED